MEVGAQFSAKLQLRYYKIECEIFDEIILVDLFVSFFMHFVFWSNF